MRSIADEMIRQGSNNRILNSYKKEAKLLAKNQMELVTKNSSSSQEATFQRQLGAFFKTIPDKYLECVIAFFNKSFQKSLENIN